MSNPDCTIFDTPLNIPMHQQKKPFVLQLFPRLILPRHLVEASVERSYSDISTVTCSALQQDLKTG